MPTDHRNNIEYTECYVAFIDILGFSSIVKKSVTDARLLAKLTRAMNFLAEPKSGTKVSRRQTTDGNWQEKHWRIQTRAFSDTVVIFMPTETGGISQLLFVVRYLHDRMLELGLCMRGAVTIGGMYWNDAWSNPPKSVDEPEEGADFLYERGRNQNFWVTLGPGLIEAYTLESECAIYPRILISPCLYDHVSQEGYACPPVGPYQPPERQLTEFFRVDADGWHFFDVLNRDVTRSDTERIVRSVTQEGTFSIEWQRDGNTHETVLRHVDKAIKKGLKEPFKVRAKYEWLKSYRESIN